MSKKVKATNGIENVLTPEMEARRQRIVNQELIARDFKATYEHIYYALETEKLLPEWNAYKERREAEAKAYQDMVLREAEARLKAAQEAEETPKTEENFEGNESERL